MLKLRHVEKTTKFEKISHIFGIYSVASKQVGRDIFQFIFGLFRKAEVELEVDIQIKRKKKTVFLHFFFFIMIW